MYKTKDKTFSVRLTESEYEYLQQAADAHDVKPGAFIRLLLSEYKKKENKD